MAIGFSVVIEGEEPHSLLRQTAELVVRIWDEFGLLKHMAAH